VVGSVCPGCGAVVVASDVLDSLLAMPAESVSEQLDDHSPDVPRLTVAPGSVGATTEVDGEPPAVRSFWDEPSLVDDPDPVGRSDDPAVPDVRGADPVAPAPPLPSGPPVVGTEPTEPPQPLPRRTPLAATEPQWGPRQHPPAVPAPPPPHPLDAPAVARVKRPSGTGLLAGISAGGPAPVPNVSGVPTQPPIPPAMSVPVPERPVHPRVRRWFGRGTEAEPETVDDLDEVPSAAPVPLDGPFAGAPDGLLAGVVPEDDLGPGVRDPAGLDAAMSRLSAGARRSALAPLGVVATVLEPGEVAEAVVQGDFQHRPAVVVLTDRRVVVANDRRWSPDVRTFDVGDGLVVHGWQDDRRATLVFVVGGVGVVIDAISDRPLARDLAQRVRARCAGGPPGVEPGS
jgi:hypothetical protein